MAQVQMTSQAGSQAGPTLATDGVALPRGAGSRLNAGDGVSRDPGDGYMADDYALIIQATRAAGGASSVAITYAKLWAYFVVNKKGVTTGYWMPVGAVPAGGTGGTEGKLNNAVAFAENYSSGATAEIRHVERVRGLREATRVYLELNTVTNSGLVDSWLVKLE